MKATKHLGFRIFGTLLVFSMLLTTAFASFQMEWGSTTSTAETWVNISLNNNYQSPIVVATPEYSVTTQPYGISTWITNVTNTSFLLRTSDENFGSTDDITVHYIVMEEGNWTLPSGIKVEAGKLSTNRVGSAGAGNWGCPVNGVTVTFANSFDSNPLVMSARGSDNNPTAWATTFQNDPANEQQPVPIDEMCIGLSQSKAISPGTITNNEDIYWIAADEGNGTLSGIEYEILWQLQDTGDSGGTWINGYGDAPPYTQSWAHTWTGTPDIIVAGATSVAGTDGGWPVIYDVGDINDIRIFIDEANERAHSGSESGGGWAFDTSGSIGLDAPQILNGSLNETFIQVNNTIEINATVNDKQGNNTVENVFATIDTNTTQYNLSLTPELVNLTLNSSDLESGNPGYIAQTGGDTIGEAGSVNLVDRDTTLISFTRTYARTPVIIAVASTENTADNNPFIPIVHSINTTHANISLCQDDGLSTNCATGYSTETVDYFIFDRDRVQNYSWIDVGYVNATTNGAGTPFSFNKTFANAPYVWGLPQTYNIGSPGVAAHQWFTSITTSGANINACDHPYGAGSNEDNCAGTATETYGYVAIDLTNSNISDSEGGTQAIGASTWTSIIFANSYINPKILVGVNNENGAQDGKYPWARDVTGVGADIRYCEHDGNSDCDTHNAEDTRWFVVEEGDIKIGNGGDDTEREGDFIFYQNIINDEIHNMSKLSFKVNVSIYNNSGSTSKSNNDPDLELQIQTSSQWISLGNFQVTGPGEYIINTTNNSIIDSWSVASNRDLRIRPVNMDFASAGVIDQINWTDVYVDVDYRNYNGKWSGIFTNTSICGDYNLSLITAIDEDGLSNSTTFNQIFTVSCAPVINILYPLSTEKIIGNGTINFTWETIGEPGNVTCEFIINGVVESTFNCTTGQNTTIPFTLSSGFYNWSVNATDSLSNEGSSSSEIFYNIIDRDMRIEKRVEFESSNQYVTNIFYTNLLSHTYNTTVLDFIHDPFTYGSFNIIQNFTDIISTPPYAGDVLGWYRQDTTQLNYSITSPPSSNATMKDLFIIGLD